MTREEQIKQQANIYSDDSNNYTEWSDDGGWSDSDDREFVEKAFIEGAKWADEHPNLLNNEKYHTVQVSVLDELYGKIKLYEELFEQDRIDIIKYLIEKGYPVSTDGDIPTYEQSMQAMTDLYNYKKEEWLETACKWLNDNIFEYPWWDDDAPSFDSDDIVNDFRKAMEK